MTYSPKTRRNLLATSANADLLVLLEITHPDLVVPVRVVNDNVDFTVAINDGGVPTDITFVKCAFDLTLPDDVDQQVPKARLSVSNIGRELTEWLEYSGGGKGAKIRILQTMRSDAKLAAEFDSETIKTWNPWEMDLELDMSAITIDNLAVSSDLGYQNTMNLSAVAMRFDPISSPGLF